MPCNDDAAVVWHDLDSTPRVQGYHYRVTVPRAEDMGLTPRGRLLDAKYCIVLREAALRRALRIEKPGGGDTGEVESEFLLDTHSALLTFSFLLDFTGDHALRAKRARTEQTVT